MTTYLMSQSIVAPETDRTNSVRSDKPSATIDANRLTYSSVTSLMPAEGQLWPNGV